MIIQSSEVHMNATHEKSESRSFAMSSNLQFGDIITELNAVEAKKLRGNAQFEALFNQFFGANATTGAEAENDEAETPSLLVMTKEGFKFRTADDDLPIEENHVLATIKMFRRLLEAISQQYGYQYNNDNADIEEAKNAAQTTPTDQVADVDTPNDPAGFSGLQGIRIQMSFSSTFTIEESEKTDFSSAGTVTTADGKTISFDLEMSMQREYSYTETNEFTQSVLFKDPIVINYPGSSAELSDEKFAFDIDADGNDDLISYFNSGAMLALDKNNDGIINDGSELFGALSGNGFADLAAYDEDGNNYIDEADSIFSELKLWTKTADQDILTDLSGMDIGAIYLGASDTPFDVKGEGNQFNGKVQATSFYLTEAGDVGTVQQVDMVV